MKRILMFLGLFLLLTSCGTTKSIDYVVQTEEKERIMIDIKGRVCHPGVYELDGPKYLYEVIELAGGLIPNTDTNNINLVQLIDKSCSVSIALNQKDNEEEGLLNINYASLSQLTKLPGIGEAYARNIIQYREEHGLFLVKEDIKLVPGIKDNVFNQIKDQITV